MKCEICGKEMKESAIPLMGSHKSYSCSECERSFIIDKNGEEVSEEKFLDLLQPIRQMMPELFKEVSIDFTVERLNKILDQIKANSITADQALSKSLTTIIAFLSTNEAVAIANAFKKNIQEIQKMEDE
jgi:hypothetical protein